MADLTRIENALHSQYKRWDIFYCTTGSTVAQFLAENLSDFTDQVDCGAAIEMQTYLNGRRSSLDSELRAPVVLEVYLPKVNRYSETSYAWSTENILYREGGIAVVYKPAGLATLPSKESSEKTLRDILMQELGSDLHLPSRLDFSTQGLVLCSYCRSKHSFVQSLFEKRTVKKWYLCQVSKKPTWQTIEVAAPIAQDPRHPILRKVVVHGGKTAKTTFQLLSPCSNNNVLLAIPVSGRTHQIRVHAQHLGHPIIGDNFYNGAEARQLHLLSFAVAFQAAEGSDLTLVKAPARLMPTWARDFEEHLEL